MMGWPGVLPLVAVVVLTALCSCCHARNAADGGIYVRLEAETPAAHAEEEKDFALTLLRSWALGDERKFVELADVGVTVHDVMANTGAFSAVVIVVRGEHPPHRRNVSAGQPFLEVEPTNLFFDKNAALEHNLPVDTINRAAELLEQFFSGPLFPFKLASRNFNRVWRKGKVYGPFAIYDFSEGVIYVDRSVPQNIAEVPMRARAAIESFSQQLFEGLGAALRKVKEQAPGDQTEQEGASSVARAARLVAKTSAAALAATLAAQVPVWFCVACPLVLGLLAPFAFNLGLGAVAEELCQHYNLPSDECNELWYGAFALAMVLSLASAIPIVYVCRLPECARRRAPFFLPAYA